MALTGTKSSKSCRTEVNLWEAKEYSWISIIPWSKHQSPAKKHFSPLKNWPGEGKPHATNYQKTQICSTCPMGRKRGKRSKLLPSMTGWLDVCTEEKGELDAQIGQSAQIKAFGCTVQWILSVSVHLYVQLCLRLHQFGTAVQWKLCCTAAINKQSPRAFPSLGPTVQVPTQTEIDWFCREGGASILCINRSYLTLYMAVK